MQTKSFTTAGTSKADAAADIALINRYTLEPLKAEDVFAFSVNLCDNEIDRDIERFPEASLRKLAGLFVGKTGVSDHDWSADKQRARIYRAEVERTGKKNSLGEELLRLRASAYMLNNEANRSTIEAINGGILKEVSVGVSTSCTCSICGQPMRECREHTKGQRYGGKLCYGSLEDPSDAFEFSFVAVPSQRGAGVTKSAAIVRLDQYASEMPKAQDKKTCAAVPASSEDGYSIEYAIIPESSIYRDTVKAAHEALAFAEHDLRLPPVDLHWFTTKAEATARYGVKDLETFRRDAGFCGSTDPNGTDAIFVRVMSSDFDVHEAVLHECYHLKQFKRNDGSTLEEKERFAYEYQHDSAMRLLSLSAGELSDLYIEHLARKDWSR